MADKVFWFLITLGNTCEISRATWSSVCRMAALPGWRGPHTCDVRRVTLFTVQCSPSPAQPGDGTTRVVVIGPPEETVCLTVRRDRLVTGCRCQDYFTKPVCPGWKSAPECPGQLTACSLAQVTRATKNESLWRINAKQTYVLTHVCNSCKFSGSSRLQDLHETKPLFVSLIIFIRSRLSFLVARVSRVSVICRAECDDTAGSWKSDRQCPLSSRSVSSDQPLS